MDMDSVIIRRMTKEDIDDVIKVEEAAYGQHHWSKESFLAELSNDLAKYFVLCDKDENLCAYIGCWQIFDEAHITNIAVSPNYRRRHYAEALLKKVIDDCIQNLVKYLTLEVRVSNLAAISLYEKYGFKSLGTRRAYYQDNNEDALIMWTENIFYDKFKVIYEKNIKALGEKIIINE